MTSVPVAHESMSVYRACPAGAEPSGTVIVGFEMFGLTRYIRAVTERIATLGYTALAPDFYHRSGDRIDLPATPAGRARGLALLGELDRPGVIDDVRNVIDHLAEPGHTATPAAMVGLSAGGHIAYAVATEIPLCALALFYPGWLTEPGTALGRPEPLLDLTPRIAALGTPVRARRRGRPPLHLCPAAADRAATPRGAGAPRDDRLPRHAARVLLPRARHIPPSPGR